MTTLLLRCVGPLQAWGTQSHFDVRETGREPSKSGIIGMLSAALGRARSEPVADLARLRMGIRVDREGHLLRDFHTAGIDGYFKASGSIERKNAIVSTRYYLADAAFLVGLEGDKIPLEEAHSALRDPNWPLFLGRKACVPGEPPWLADGLQEVDLETALQTYPWLGHNEDHYNRLTHIRVVFDDPDGAEVRNDHPLSFAERHFGPRRVSTSFIDPPPYRPENVSEEPS
jgi:CRISPR system Cascade subunit CasD